MPLKVGVICNPKSHQNRRAEIAHAVPVPDVILAMPRTHGQLAATLSEFAASGIDLLAIDGGDGTIRDVLSAAAEAFETMPQVAILPTGKTNALAIDLGVPAGWGLDSALAAVARGGMRRRAPLVVGRAGSPDLHGFLFGTGAFVRSTALAQRAHGAGAFNNFAVALATVWGVLKTLFGGRDGEWRRGDPLRLTAEGKTIADGAAFILLASTLERLPLGVRPFGPPRRGLKAVMADAPARWLPAVLVAVLSGRRGGWIERLGYRHRDFMRAELVLDSDFILDGEVYPGGTLTLGEGAPVEFLVP